MDNREALITGHLGMARKMARRISRRLPATVSREDVESAAFLGLTEAATRYDETRNEPFMAFASKRVRGAILDHLRRNDWLTRRGRQEARRVADAEKTLEAEYGRSVSDSEIAEKMGISDDEFNANYAGLREATVVHLEELPAMPQNVTSGTPNECIQRQQIRAALIRALDRLEERERIILACYYQEGLTLREIGQILGVTESRVCQLHAQTLRTLRSQLS
ncbi:MAG: FliA/WhiG family RNA polymerase sigma factor [Proteobacteria bacterium]|nr:FliA/WhiG family RNA polymerase sigma factor [Pseudomonadota bacterium]